MAGMVTKRRGRRHRRIGRQSEGRSCRGQHCTEERSKLYVITVVRPPGGLVGNRWCSAYCYALAKALDQAQHGVLDLTIKDLDTEGIEVQTVEELGDPAATIIGFCSEVEANLLVVGRRGAGLIERFVMGSVSDRLAHYAPCPVLMIP